MNVYEINGVFIASENADKAFGEYLEETNYLDNLYIDELNESEEENVTINIRRLTQKAIETKNMECCEDGCNLCEEKGDYVYISLQDIIEKETKFPCVIAKEE